jgi:PIN domain nuclease of toxin-antitoxin system
VEGVEGLIVLDTNAWIWWVSDPSRLSSSARRALVRAEADAGLVISTISISGDISLEC